MSTAPRVKKKLLATQGAGLTEVFVPLRDEPDLARPRRRTRRVDHQTGGRRVDVIAGRWRVGVATSAAA